jgi:hypothetical protein
MVQKGHAMKRYILLLLMSMVVIVLSQASAAPTAQAATIPAGSPVHMSVDHGSPGFGSFCEDDG